MLANNRRLMFLTALASLLLSAWAVWLDPIINNDGILYLRVAEAFYDGDIETAVGLYQWPLYPYLISLVKTILPISFEQAAHLLNALFYVLIVWGFLAIIYELGGNRRTLVIAALVILLFPTLSKYRSYLIRDPGFLVGYLWSLVFFFRYWKQPDWSTALMWLMCALFAFLFRIEGLIFLLLAPISWLWARYQTRTSRIPLLILSAASVMIVSWGFLLWLYGPAGGATNQVLASPWLHAQASWWEVVQETQYKVQAIKQEFLNQGSEHFSIVVYMMTLILILLWTVVHRMAIAYAVISVYAITGGSAFPERRLLSAWWWIVWLNIVGLLVFTFAMTFLSGRYVVALVLTLMLAVPFGLDGLWTKHDKRLQKVWVFPAIVLLCFALGLRGLDVATKKTYLKTAGHWIAQNIPSDARIFFSNKKLIYYSGFNNYRNGANYNWAEVMHFVNRKAWQDFDYLVVQVGRGRDHRIRQLNRSLKRPPEMTINGERGGSVLVYHFGKI